MVKIGSKDPTQHPIPTGPVPGGVQQIPPKPENTLKDDIAHTNDAFLQSKSPKVGNSTWLRDMPSDLNGPDAISHVEALREKSQLGKTITRADLFTMSSTVEAPHLKLHMDRDYFTEGLIPAIANAEDTINIAMLTLDGGELGQYLVDLLIEKKRENPTIEIRLIADQFNSSAIFPWSAGSRNLQRLEEAGIDVKLNWILERGAEHRKVVVIDGKQAFFGGSCFGDQYFGNKEYWSAYKEAKRTNPNFNRDTVFNPSSPNAGDSPEFAVTPEMELPEFHDYGVEFKGSAVAHLQANFLQTWFHQGGEFHPGKDWAELQARYFPPTDPSEEPIRNDTHVKLIHGVPKGESEFRQGVLEVVDSAEETLDIQFAYILIPEFIDRVREAAKRGVKIRILTPGEEGTDNIITWALFRGNYESLLKAGDVKLYEFNTYTHCKFVVADKRMVFVSTGNPEYHSWEFGFDESAIIDSVDMAAEIEERVFSQDLSEDRAIQVKLEDVENPSLWTQFKLKIFQFFFWLFQRPVEAKRPRLNLIER